MPRNIRDKALGDTTIIQVKAKRKTKYGIEGTQMKFTKILIQVK